MSIDGPDHLELCPLHVQGHDRAVRHPKRWPALGTGPSSELCIISCGWCGWCAGTQPVGTQPRCRRASCCFGPRMCWPAGSSRQKAVPSPCSSYLKQWLEHRFSLQLMSNAVARAGEGRAGAAADHRRPAGDLRAGDARDSHWVLAWVGVPPPLKHRLPPPVPPPSSTPHSTTFSYLQLPSTALPHRLPHHRRPAGDLRAVFHRPSTAFPPPLPPLSFHRPSSTVCHRCLSPPSLHSPFF